MKRQKYPARKLDSGGGSNGRSPSRRELLAMLSVAGAGMALKHGAANAQISTQAEAKSTGIIDTHHHIYPPRYVAANLKRLADDAPDFPDTLYKTWTPRVSLDQMDQNGIQTAIVSMTSPGVWWGNNEEGRKWARECVEYGAKLIQDYPGRFGMFAPIPLPDTEGSLREIAYALDVLKLDGIGLLSGYAGKLLGDPSFTPVFDELNRRKAVVFVHPTMSSCGNPVPPVGAPIIEFPTDTARAIVNLIYRGAFVRYRDIRFIFSHGGGVLTSIVSRIGIAARTLTPEQRAAAFPNGLEFELRRQFYDVALVAQSPVTMAAAVKLFPMTQLLFGSDTPFIPIAETATASNKLELPAPGDVRAIQRENAVRLFPRLKA
jgi:6-methylsalicylate decarboxylase